MMTLEDARKRHECIRYTIACFPGSKGDCEAVDIAFSALRSPTREQVEKAWTAEWTVDEFGHKCSKCGEYLPDGEDVRKPQFCPECGRAMTDEAVEMVMERLEALHETVE